MGVAQQRYFYRLQELNAKEKELIYRLAISESYGKLKEVNSEWLKLFTLVFDIKSQLESRGALPTELAQMFKDIELQLEESLHSFIEGRSKSYLDELLNENADFYLDQEESIDFCFFFAMQYVRTPRILENMRKNANDLDGVDAAKVWSVSKVIFGTNIAWSIYAKRHQYKLNILKSDGARFITADQPIINTQAVNFEAIPEGVEFFYPISPELAVLISEDNDEPGALVSIDDDRVSTYNRMIFYSSYKQVYAAERSDLEPFVGTT